MGTILHLEEHQVEAASELLARAFFDGPLDVFIIPDAQRGN
ncbi:MAG: hypothetical protein ACR2PL_10570 [Dehalococcoidia bacterium]